MNLPIANEQRVKVEEFQRRHHVALLTLVFTDLVGSTKLKQNLGEAKGVALIQEHKTLVREALTAFEEAEEIETAGDSFFIVFTKPSDALKFSLLLQARLRTFNTGAGCTIVDRVGINVGEVFIERREGVGKSKDLYGIQVDVCARVMSLAAGDQILMTRSAFDHARQVIKGQEIGRFGTLSWLNHGPYVLKGVDDPVEICEVGEIGNAVLSPPPDSDKVRRYISPGAEPVVGWRPAVGQVVPNTHWLLEERLGEEHSRGQSRPLDNSFQFQTVGHRMSAAHLQPLPNPRRRHHRLPPQSARNHHLLPIRFHSLAQLLLCPLPFLQFLPHGPFRILLRTLPDFRPCVMLSGLSPDLLQQPILQFPRPIIPSSPHEKASVLGNGYKHNLSGALNR